MGGGVGGGAVGLKQEVILRSSKNVTTEVGRPNRFAISNFLVDYFTSFPDF